MAKADDGGQRQPLSRDRVLRAAVALADEAGLEAISMRKLSQTLGVVPMALYKHVANKEELLDGMIDVVVGEIEPAMGDSDWKAAVRRRILSARTVMLRHPWARRVMEAQAAPTPVILAYTDSVIRTFLAGGLSADLVHHVMHALGSRIFGFTQELHETAPTAPADLTPEQAAYMMAAFPGIAAVAMSRPHDPNSVVGSGCDDEFEFEFGIDLMLDGVERLQRKGWDSSDHDREDASVL
ncbi:TetR/AcrR family transcriptional regulator C-terminal domain-containing protein [Sinomonas sp. JGH33]|uniref:TetR/AcrR family transcriptional regulator C-terminal domain-containing protein n=1 Tax=Sinomonas terricola TaxID=3110330 RepID=A0ABU5T528_9MICC|nr:TetR/AcrR family transcriptional regulator C-terminal domain-containing protein [Sinomonas sp. JGH33]MEA5454772.1 TetR/AcrR family transcriptional regulator C-terminal domain-containing protein [Sinomonas sp. JGH33]